MKDNNIPSIIKIWAVHQGDNEFTNGYPYYFFLNEVDALYAAKNKGWYGGPAPVTEQWVLLIHDKMYLLQKNEPIKFGLKTKEEEMRERALKKLTQEEKKVLGLA